LGTFYRASRDTELLELAASHVVDTWIGHDEAVAKKNYLQVTDDHFAIYTGSQKAKQSDEESGSIELHANREAKKTPAKNSLCCFVRGSAFQSSGR